MTTEQLYENLRKDYEKLVNEHLTMHNAVKSLIRNAGHDRAVKAMQDQVENLREASQKARATADSLDREAEWLQKGIDSLMAEDDLSLSEVLKSKTD